MLSHPAKNIDNGTSMDAIFEKKLSQLYFSVFLHNKKHCSADFLLSNKINDILFF